MNFFKSTIIYSFLIGILFVFFSFFLFPAQTNACELDLQNNPPRFRTATTNGGIQPVGWFTEENPPFVYVDFKTVNCTSSDSIYLTIFGLNEDGAIVPTISNNQINLSGLDQNNGMSIAFHPDERPCYGNLSDTSNSDCLIFAIFTDLPGTNPNSSILGIIGDLLGGVSLQDAQAFSNQFGNGLGPTAGCANFGAYFFQTTQNCLNVPHYFSNQIVFQGDFPQKLINYYNSYGGAYSLLPIPQQEARVAFAGLLYQCEGWCWNDDWQFVPAGTLPYGETAQGDQGFVAVSPLADIYQESYVPLAPLPFEGLDGGSTPTLGGYLASMFKMGIVVVVILAVIMIVFHGIALATVGAIQKKDEHKKGVWNAILGLLLAMGSWLLLNTINPELASNLGIGIPEVSLDGPDPAWQNGNAPAGTQISSSALLNGQPITQGMPWPDDTPQRTQLANASISVVSSQNSNCTPTAGTPGCTSVYFDSTASSVISNILSFKQACNCELIVTGGSEAWLHSSHGPNKKIIDFRATPTLNQYLRSLPGGPSDGETFPSGQQVIISGVGKFYAEPSGATGNTTAKHWHVTFY